MNQVLPPLELIAVPIESVLLSRFGFCVSEIKPKIAESAEKSLGVYVYCKTNVPETRPKSYDILLFTLVLTIMSV